MRITRPLIAYHEHNAAEQRPKLLAALADGKAVALVSDAGTPLALRPRLPAGRRGDRCRARGDSGARRLGAARGAGRFGPADRRLLLRRLPAAEAVARQKRLTALANVPGSLVFYESPRRLAAALADMADVLGGARPAAVARELTKAFETVRRGTLAGLAAEFADEEPPKGEIVVVVGPPSAIGARGGRRRRAACRLLATGTVRTAADEAAALTGLPRRDLYQRALALKGRRR